MLTVASVQVSNYCGRGREYVEKLYSNVRRHMPKGIEWKGVCFTDDPSTVPEGIEAREVPFDLAGWWNKLSLFRPRAFEPGERVLFFDLDTLFAGDLGDIASYSGPMALMRDPYRPEHHGSAVMAWEAGGFDHIWTIYENGGMPQFDPRGDQRFIESVQPKVDFFHDLYPGQIISFKVNCWMQGGIPDNARVIGFHGHPRPHECRAKYIQELWNQPVTRSAFVKAVVATD